MVNILFEDQFLYHQVASCISGYQKLLLSYSGGLDSTVLLDILSTIIKHPNFLIHLDSPKSLRAVYVDHGLNKKSHVWADHCFQQCQVRNISFHIAYIEYDNINNKYNNIESVSRELRYRKLYDYLESGEVLITAHHMDDQVETFFLALKRGSGLSGLSGMTKNMLYYRKYRLLRPLLQCSRKQLEQYAYKKKLVWIEDDTNLNMQFDRNFLRIQILPKLQKRWNGFNKVVFRVSQICRNQQNLIHELLSEYINTLINVDGSLHFYPLLKVSLFKRQVILRCWLSNFFIYMPSYQLLHRLWKEVVLSKNDATPILNLGKYICRRFRKNLYILPMNLMSPLSALQECWSLTNNVISLPEHLGVLIFQAFFINKFAAQKILKSSESLLSNFISDYRHNAEKILTYCLIRPPNSDEKVSIKFGHVDGLLYIIGRKHGRKLKKIWQELNIPPWLRTRIPLLFYNNTLIAAIGVFVTQSGSIKVKYNNITKDNYYTIWKILWVQDKFYFQIFRSIVHIV